MQLQLLYDYDGVTIMLALLGCILLLNELGFRFGRFVQDRTDAEIKAFTGAIQASILGLLALLLGFTFSMSMQRYDSCNQAMIAEANAIGNTLMRVQLLPMQHQEPANALLAKYIDIRVALGNLDLSQDQQRREHIARTRELQHELWSLAVEATKEDARAVTTGAFLNSLTELIDNHHKRNALLQIHVPEEVLFVLLIVFVTAGGILGYSGGLSGQRVLVPTTVVALIIALIVFVIIDLDRPMRGLIRVSDANMLELQRGE